MPERFTAYGAAHFAVLVLGAVVLVACIGLGRRLARRDPDAERRLRFAWCAAIVVIQVASHLHAFAPGRYDVLTSWPIHFCDVAILAAFVALAFDLRPARTVLHFWGLVYSPFAFCLPTVQDGPALTGFWLFWVGHFQIVGSALYSFAVQGYRPRRRDLVVAIATTVGYAIAVLPVNLALGTDYGFVGRTSPPTEFLGPWPARVVVLVALQSLGCLVLYCVTRGTACVDGPSRGSSGDGQEES